MPAFTPLANPAQYFQGLGISIDKPGFYDDPRFIAAEKQNPQLLNTYAEYVIKRPYDQQYLDRAEKIIKATAKFLYSRLEQADALSKCIDASMMAMRILERYGIWCIMAQGALTIEFDPKTNIDSRYFQPLVLSTSSVATGHAWLYAPPFKVMDLTVSLQPYPSEVKKILPKYILEKTTAPATYSIIDIMDNDAALAFVSSSRRMPTLEDLDTINPGLRDVIDHFGPQVLKRNSTSFKYITTSGTASDDTLEQQKNLTLGGKSPIDLFTELTDALTRSSLL